MVTIHTVVSPNDLLSHYTDEFYRLTNEQEKHRDIQYITGVNTDILEFNPKGECELGGLYFFHVSHLYMYQKYCINVKYIRKVTFTGKSKIYVEENKFKTNEFVLGEREIFDTKKYITDWLCSTEKCIKVVTNYVYAMPFIKNEYQTEELCKMAIKNNGFRYISDVNKTYYLCKIAVQFDGLNIKHINKCILSLHNDLYELAIQQNADALKYVDVQTEELCRLSIQKNGLCLRFVADKNLTYELSKLAVENNGMAIKYVKGKFLTYELIYSAVKENGSAIQFINKKYITENLSKLAVQQCGENLKFISDENQTKEICEIAVQKDGLALEYVRVEFLSEDIYKLAVQQNGFALRYIYEQTDKICKLAVHQNGLALEYVNEQTYEICETAVLQNNLAIKMVEDKYNFSAERK